jgi:peptidoglycan/LPS O-acetylase OafA/YrhL
MQKNNALQSMRGLAALVVLLGHSQLLLSAKLQDPLPSMLFQAGPAVIFFFVLSGFVLGQSLRRSSTFGAFALKRLARLIPVYWSAVFFGVLCYRLLWHDPIVGVDPWLGGTFAGWPSVTLRQIGLNLAAQTVSLNGVLWSVQIEIFMIPIFPVLVAVAARTRLRTDMAILAMLLVLSLFLMFRFAGTPLDVAPHISFFYAGVIIPKFLEFRPMRDLLASGILFGASMTAWLFSGAFGFHFGLSYADQLTLAVVPSVVAIAYVLLNPGSVTSRFLLLRPLVWLGDISYSFYAFGNALLQVCALAVIEIVPREWLLSRHSAAFVVFFAVVLTLAILLPLAGLSERFIERPFIRWGAALITRRKLRYVATVSD